MKLNTNSQLMRSFYILVIGMLLTALLMSMSSCAGDPKKPGRIYMPDMTYSQAYETYATSPNFEDGLSARKPVAGTISRGTLPSGQAWNEDPSYEMSFLHTRYFPETNEGYEKAGEMLKNPLLMNDKVLAEGKLLYGIYCEVCHGKEGAGNGAIVASGAYPAVPAYKDRLPTINEGKMYHSITYGKNLMGGYASQVTAEERWKLIYYIQQLGEVGPFAKNNVETLDSTAVSMN